MSRSAVPPQDLTAPIVHQGIPGDRAEGGVYVERSLVGEDRLHDVSVGTNPILPVQPGRFGGSEGDYLDDCPCPTGSRPEGEPDCGVGSPCDFVDTFNGGCNSSPPVYSPIKLGDVVCGETTYDLALACRDTDWYETVLATETTVTWRVTGDFDKLCGILDPSLGCGAPVFLVFDTALDCSGDATVSATLPAGTWWFFIAPQFTGGAPCGTNYTATLTGGCEIYTSEAAFDAAHPGLTLEDFEDFAVAPGSFCAAQPTPWDSTTANACVSPGDITPGLEIDSVSSGTAYVLGIGYGGVGNLVDSDQVLPTAGGPISELRFDSPVRSVGLELEFLFPGGGTVDVELFDAGGGLIFVTTASIADSTETFWGVSCDTPIAVLRISDGSGLFMAYGSVRFGGTGDCEFITNELQFDTRFPGLLLEDFEDTSITPGTTCVDAEPWDSTTTNGCISAGEIEPGLSLFSPDAASVALVGIGYACGFDPIDSDSAWGACCAIGMEFEPPVTRVGFDLEMACSPSQPAVIEITGPGGVPMGSWPVTVTDTQAFYGIACDGLIESVAILPGLGIAVEVDNIRYGTGCQVIADADTFDNLYPDLAFEDFEDGNVAPLDFCVVLTNPVDLTGDGACFDPLDIEPGVAIGTVSGDGLVLAGAGIACGGVNPVDSNVIGPSILGEVMELTFGQGVRQVGLDIETCSVDPTDYSITVFGTGGEILASLASTHGFTQSFFGITSDAPIGSMTIAAPGDVPFLDNVRFGTSKLPFTRFCVEESVASVNTGLKTKMLLETQNGAGALLPFQRSITFNGSPNRLMMIAKDAPGLGNGGVTNIGYFIMGTGSNTFVPPGSIGPICVAPGIKRYLPPTSMTSETIVFHDAGGTPTTLVAQGFSRAALGAGAHPIGANIGGVLGFHWSFQAWHRDTPGDSNLSDAVAVDFVP